MNNLHRELAPISSEAWAQIEEEATRTFKRNIAGRRVVDVSGPHGFAYSALNRGRLTKISSPDDGVLAHQRVVQPLIELRVPFTLSRQELDDVERGAGDADLDNLKAAAQKIAFAEDRAIFESYAAAGITGIRAAASNEPVELPGNVVDIPDAISHALTGLRLAGVQGPYSVVLSAELYTQVSETSDHGHPIRTHIERLIDGEIIWAPAISGGFALTTRGGDFELALGQDLSIGYLSHDAETVQLYFQESFTFLVETSEAAVSLGS
ncbi:family 1 encapsulin nanocompartment shell protein [Nocardia rhizosphaerihabitans]|uniref:Type 1 encapsulin shell protein n=1 Tax=Nocardia rhizosphaerihabitans TaxID=1691570 RepID=A0ABQ2K8F0_9NOCA|nr:family 1 encapsulin nanocompartment shell protein [Nocardia rhizosphaerihabitans]GGN73903.1 bacteriocin [Nocardia rhizosphaerihabitans]